MQLGFSAGTVDYTSIAVNTSNTPYVVYKDVANSNKASVKRFDGTSWVTVGAIGFSSGTADYSDIVIGSNNIPYVIYRDGAQQEKQL